MAEAGDHHRRPRPSRPRKRLPKFPEIQAQSQYGGQRGHMLTLVRDELHQPRLHRRGDRRRWPAGHHHLHPRRRWHAAEAGRARAPAARGLQRQGAARRRRHASSPAPARCAASTAARTTSSPRSTGPSPAAWPARRSSRSRSRPRSRTASRSRTPSTATRPTSSAGRDRGRNEGPGDGHDYGSAVSLINATEESINTAFVDMSNGDGRRPGEDHRDGRTSWGSRRASRRRVPRHPATQPRPRARRRLITLGTARVSPINMANAYATIAERRPARRGARHREGRRGPHGEATTTPASRRPRTTRRRGHRRRRLLRPAAGRQERHRAPPRWRSAARPPARPAPRPTTTDEVSSSWFVGLHPAAGDRGDVRPRRRRRPARRLAAVVLRRRLPDPHLDRGDDQRRWRALPVEEFPPPANVDGDAPDDGHDPYAAAAEARRRPRRRAARRARRRRASAPPSDDRRRPTPTEPTSPAADPDAPSPSDRRLGHARAAARPAARPGGPAPVSARSGPSLDERG